MLQSHPGDGEDIPFKGSMIIYTGESVEDVRSVLMNDVYAKKGVWDLEKVQIIPVSPYSNHDGISSFLLTTKQYVSAVREPMS